MTFHRDDPTTWPYFSPTIIAHDVGRSRDRSTAVVGGLGPFVPPLIGIKELHELPQGLYGSPRASALAAIDRQSGGNALIVADLSNDPTYAEVLVETFRSAGDRPADHTSRRWPKSRASPRQAHLDDGLYDWPSYLLDLFRAELQAKPGSHR